jgi:hypothetical protein
LFDRQAAQNAYTNVDSSSGFAKRKASFEKKIEETSVVVACWWYVVVVIISRLSRRCELAIFNYYLPSYRCEIG